MKVALTTANQTFNMFNVQLDILSWLYSIKFLDVRQSFALVVECYEYEKLPV